jgi:hypothetical protein
MATLNKACTHKGSMRGAAQMASSDTSTGNTMVFRAERSARRGLPWWCQRSTSSIKAATPARISNSQTVPGVLPVCSMASVKAP